MYNGYKKYPQDVNMKYPIRKPEIKCAVVDPKSCIHHLKFAGGSSNGRIDGISATVYKCVKCDKYGYVEDFGSKIDVIDP